jgi:hypothetical protein
LPVAPDFVIHTDGQSCYAEDRRTGLAAFSFPDAGAVLSSCIRALALKGGTVAFKAGTYAWLSTPSLPCNLPTWLSIVGEPGVTINLSVSGRRFLDFDRAATGDTFRYIHIEGFTIDGTAIASLGGRNHIVIGTVQDGNFSSGYNINLDHIVIRRGRTLNLSTNISDSENDTYGRGIVVYGSATNTIAPGVVIVDDCDFQGMKGGTEIIAADATNAARVLAYRNRWREFPKAPYELSLQRCASATATT